jgi:hypothetical protein
MAGRTALQEILFVTLTKAELEFLQKHAFPGCEELLATAAAVEGGFELSGTGLELEDLLGWVADEANHSREKRRKRATEAFDAIADKLDAELGY